MRTSGKGFQEKFGHYRMGGIIRYILFLHLSFFLFTCSKNEEATESHIPKLNPDFYNVAFLIMDGVYNTELTAPYDIFHHTIFRDSIKPMNVFTVAEKNDAILTFEGLKIIPDFNYLSDSLPDIDILVVPSAEHHLDSDLENKKMLEWVRTVSSSSSIVMSHCDGAFVLAESGILEGRESTTYPGEIETYRKRYPSLTVHDSVFFVHDGKFITSAGGAKSFEASLYLIELLYGKKVAEQIAKGMVIEWDLEKIPFISVSRSSSLEIRK
jgi:transcriptional regulator GlxA family with amidase domain